MAPTALVPVKTGTAAKLRLAHLLDWRARDALARRLASHVIGVLAGGGWTVIAVTSRGAAPFDGAADTWAEDAPGLNGALRSALARVGGRALVVPSDLPWLEAGDVARLIAEEGEVVVAPTTDGGTGALLLRRPLAPAFGPRSALVHAAAARLVGLWARVVPIAGFARDLDDEPSFTLARASSPALDF